ncbi:phenylacetate--CoA ligase family protein, partial [bacterium]|nr:phenylacetate--CoA ligase family protein [bacterium]
RNHDLRSTQPDGPPSFMNKSGGSTGEPITFLWDKSTFEWVMATKDLFDEWTGYHVGMPHVILWGSERDLFAGGEQLRTMAGRWLRNELWLNSFRMTPERMRDYVSEINAHRPVQILGYAGSTYDLACFIEREGLDIHSPKAIMTSAGTLYPHMRECIERVFRAPVFNRYGTRETGDIACECSAHDGLHICMPTHYLEILRPDGSPAQPGEEGEVVLTLLTNFTMPLIRYRVGDTAIFKEGKCACGASWPMLQHVTGRLTDSFVREDGGIIPAEYMIMTLNNSILKYSWIRKCQCIQDDYTSVRVRITPWDRNCSAEVTRSEELAQIRDGIRLVMGEQCNVEFEFPEDIECTQSGKYRYVVSHVAR